MKILYFAWVRERTGLDEETVELPETISTVGEMLDWLAGRGPNYAAALEEPSVIRVALDQRHVTHDAPIGEAGEAALFPPMTGG